MASHPIYQIYAELEEYEPKIWRRFEVMNNITMARLAYILMTLFEMKANHLYNFEVDELENFENYLKTRDQKIEMFEGIETHFKIAEYGCVFGDEDQTYVADGHKPLEDASNILMKRILDHENDKVVFRYDFGDNWHVKVILEKIYEDQNLSGKELPRLIEGQGYGIIEDCGGVMGLEDVRKAFKKKQGEEYEMYCEWLGVKELDLDRCDIEDLNFRLKKIPRIYQDSYEYGLEPTKQSLNLLERKYIKK